MATLRQADWVVEGKLGAAVKLGMKPATLRHRMKKLGISRPSESGG
jgi:transcriptional regulator with GAF, ATPase, and Fis domain